MIVVIDLFAIFFGLSFARSRQAQRKADAAAGCRDPGEPAPPCAQAGERREFFRRCSSRRCGVRRGVRGARRSRSCGRTAGRVRLGDQTPEGRRHTRLHEDKRPSVLLGHRPLLHRQVQRQARGGRRLRDRGRHGPGIMPLYQRACTWGACPVLPAGRSGSSAPARLEYNTAGEDKLGPARAAWTGSRSPVSGSGVRDGGHRRDVLGPPGGTDTIHKPWRARSAWRVQ